MNVENKKRKSILVSRKLRQNMTEAEMLLWSRLRAHRFEAIHFRRQHPIGKFVVDFCAPRKKLVIELDGSQHLDQTEYDAERTVLLEAFGYRVIRFWNHDVMNDLDAVLETIWNSLQNPAFLHLAEMGEGALLPYIYRPR